MMTQQWSKKDIAGMNRVFRLNLINSITGIKPANLIGTVSSEGEENLAIFSSVFHLGSNPGLIGCISRPTAEVPRHTYENIVKTKYYTINAIPIDHVERAHYTSAKIDRIQSEFELCQIDPFYINDFPAPFVKSSPIQIGLHLEEIIDIKVNGTILIVGSIEYVRIREDLLNEKGYLNLEEGAIAGISGLNRYYSFELVAEHPYARASEMPDFNKS